MGLSQTIIIYFAFCLLFFSFIFYQLNPKENYDNYVRMKHDFIQNPSLMLSSDHEKKDLLDYICKLSCK